MRRERKREAQRNSEKREKERGSEKLREEFPFFRHSPSS